MERPFAGGEVGLDSCVSDGRQRTIAGTLSYVSPEMILGQPYGRAVDAWVGFLRLAIADGRLWVC